MLTRAGPVRTNSGYRSLKQTQDEITLSPDIEDITRAASPPVMLYLLFVVFIATLGPFQFGYHLGELNAPQRLITCQNELTNTSPSKLPQCIPMDASQWGLVQSIFTIGGLSGALLAGSGATYYGRLVAMRCLTVALLLGAVAEAAAPSMIILVLGRFLSGIGAGAATVVCPIYVAEVSPATKRGLFGAFTQVMVNTGILVSQVLGYFFSRVTQWRLILVFPGALSVFTLVGLIFVTETPKWLADNGRQASARTALHHLRGKDANIKAELNECQSIGVDEEAPLLAPIAPPAYEKRPSVSFVEVVTTTNHRRAVVAVVAVFMAQQLTGINSVMMYSVTILGSILPTGAALVTVMVSGINVLSSLLCTPLPDRIGRKACLLLSIMGMGTSSVLLVIGLSQDIVALTVVALMLFVCSFGVGLGPVPFMLPSELVGSDAVGATSSWALAGSWISTFCVAQFFPIFNSLLPRGQVYWIFASISLLLGSFIAWQLPASAGKVSPEEVWD